ncbi:cytochrome C [Defluviimonas sp. 20V17]|uniref:SoxAX cytochrome complex subunit A n=1 Tax=Allgaiera indica TaxID=765699 RepID=A0AAN4UQW1_9RHOB|nr:sulfur oxidation c-type cytochrome SoxA [Allgaiera indica]KDB02976.1 cytochrome C [Defluviimonas sp. 20V17]GHE00740.1 SoxAX cytochrome complex subunit A [Allgaiera indica]SDW69583.1 sulfur-oxidizing protein SoxA [Allgaiera indica]
MKRTQLKTVLAVAAVAALALAGVARADEAMAPDMSKVLEINGEKMITHTKAPKNIPGLSEIYSGWLFRSPSTQQMETDDIDNPGMTGEAMGETEWTNVDGTEGKSCASCHGDLAKMKGVRTHMPKVNKDGVLWSMENYINDCRTNRMGAKPWKWSGADMQDMVAAISVQSRGMPMDVQTDGPAAKYWKEGEKMYYTRYGQLQLSCANCHEDHYGDNIRADHLSQGQINGFPTYRLKTGKLTSIQNRFKGCIRDTRAHTYAEGSPELTALELYVASRGNGLSVEGVAVRP